MKKAKLFWDFNIYSDHVIEARKHDKVLVKKNFKEWVTIGNAVLGDLRVERKDDKIVKYGNRRRKLGRLWEV